MTETPGIAIIKLETIQIMNALRVLIVDDHASFRRHLRQLLTRAGLKVVGEAGDMLEAGELTRTLQPDLAVVDLNLPGQSGVSGTPQLIASTPGLRVILVSAQPDSAHVLQQSALEAGAEAFIAKDDLELELVKKWVEDTNEKIAP